MFENYLKVDGIKYYVIADYDINNTDDVYIQLISVSLGDSEQNLLGDLAEPIVDKIAQVIAEIVTEKDYGIDTDWQYDDMKACED